MLKASTIQERVLHRALVMVGGLPRLSAYLVVPENELMDWLGGFEQPPGTIYSRLCDLIEGSEGCRPTESDMTVGA